MGRAALYDQISKIKGEDLVMTQLRGRKNKLNRIIPLHQSIISPFQTVEFWIGI